MALLGFGILCSVFLASSGLPLSQVAQPALSVNHVESLLKDMTLEEKVGQMTQLEISMLLKTGSKFELDWYKMEQAFKKYGVGSILNSPFSGKEENGGYTPAQWASLIDQIQDYVREQTRLGIPITYGIDSLHGANYVQGATLFPQNHGIGATFNVDLAAQAGAITAKDSRAVGANWVFGPDVENAINPLWSRVYETFGEDPLLCAEMGRAAIHGMQGSSLASNHTVAACAKHYVGYPATRTGKDRTDAWIPDAYLHEYFLPPFKAAVEAGVETLMVNSGTVNGVPVHASKALLTDLLRNKYGFQGVIVSDWEDVIKLHSYHRVASSHREAVRMSVDAGLDISMVPLAYSFPDLLIDLVRSGEITEARIDESVRRILNMKEKLGVFTSTARDASLMETIGCATDRAAALQAARESMTLLKNEFVPVPSDSAWSKVLPLTWMKSGKVVVTGPAAHSKVALCGGWSVHWQGANSDSEFAHGMTMFEALQKTAPANVIVEYVPTCSFDSCSSEDLETFTSKAQSASVIVMAVGEAPMAESPGNIDDLFISQAQRDLYQAAASTGKNVVTVLVEARPRILGPIANSHGILMAYLPCVEGGQAIAETLWGTNIPAGRLPFTYPQFTGDLDNYFHKPYGTYSQGTANPFHSPLYDFGHGLTYSGIRYNAMWLDRYEVPYGESVKLSVQLVNEGAAPAKEAILVFLEQKYRALIAPEERMLKAFKKVEIPPNTWLTVDFKISAEDMSFFAPNGDHVLEAASFTLDVVGMEQHFTVSRKQ